MSVNTLLSSLMPPSAATAAPSSSTTHNNSTEKRSLFTVVNRYMEVMIPADRTMKVMLVDPATLAVLSMSFTQTQLLQKGVFLVHNLLQSSHRQRSTLKNMECIIFIRPEMGSVEAACRELEMGCYERYTVVFCGSAPAAVLDRLATSDIHTLVVKVEEVFCDFCAVNRDAFLLETEPPGALLSTALANSQVRRMAEGLAAMVVAQRQRPYIRFQRSSAFAKRVATELQAILKADAELYDYKNKGSVLLIIDRCDDPLTALLTPWTYQAMLHEHVGLERNTLRLPPEARNNNSSSNSGAGDDDEGEYVFSQNDDVFFRANIFNNWGDLCNNVKLYVDKCKAALQLDRSTATMEELKEFMQKIPQAKSLTGSVTKHATVTSYLSQVIKRRSLLEVSLLEQDMVATSNMSEHWERFQRIARMNNIEDRDILRLALIFHLRYEAQPGMPAHASSRTVPYLDNMSSKHAQLLRRLREYYFGGSGGLTTERLFASTGIMSRIVKTFSDVGNIYTQHEPVLKQTLQLTLSGELDRTAYPFAGPAAPGNTPDGLFKPSELSVFMCGGYTFEEAALVNSINERRMYYGAGGAPNGAPAASFLDGGKPTPHVILGGERTLNTTSFIELLGYNP